MVNFFILFFAYWQERLLLMRKIIIFLSVTLMLFGHSGKLDSKGGHTNHSTGKYHLHTGKSKNNKAFDSTIRIQILKYGFPYSWGQSFSSIERCESKIKHLLLQNAGLDYSYVCAIK